MCLIVSAPKGNQIPFELLDDATRHNYDGWGVMWHDGDRIHTHKSPKPDARAIYDLTKSNPHQTLVHLRMTTHGDNSPANTHPFEVIPERLYMMHNGVIDVDAPRHLKRSDTRVVVEDYLKPMVTKPGHLNNPGLRKFIQTLIGTSSNRLVFLDNTGKVTYFNKNLGIDWKGLWCSNTYAWTLHDEGRKTGNWRLGHSYSNDYNACYSDRDEWFSHNDNYDHFQWADKHVQAADDTDPDDELLVQTTFGVDVPLWITPFLDATYEELVQAHPDDLAQVIEHLRDHYIGEVL